MDLPLPRLRFRFRRLGSTLTCVVFFATDLPVRGRAEVWTIDAIQSSVSLDYFIRSSQHIWWNRQVDLFRRFQINNQFQLPRSLHR
jgi:hypothetical protein